MYDSVRCLYIVFRSPVFFFEQLQSIRIFFECFELVLDPTRTNFFDSQIFKQYSSWLHLCLRLSLSHERSHDELALSPRDNLSSVFMSFFLPFYQVTMWILIERRSGRWLKRWSRRAGVWRTDIANIVQSETTNMYRIKVQDNISGVSKYARR